MAHIRLRAARIPILGALFGVGLIGVLRSRRRRKPSVDQLMAMDDAAFAAFIESTGVKTVTTAGLSSSKAPAD